MGNVGMISFGGSEELVAVLDRAVAQTSSESVCRAVKQGLAELIREKIVRLPDELKQPQSDYYARRLLYRRPDDAYEVIAMIWGPGQGTPLHDHAGIWCVDGVLDGTISVTQYDLIEEKGESCRFQEQDTIQAGFGEAGSLIPPFEYHTIHNPGSEPSITIHVYGGRMQECCIFEPQENGWFVRKTKQLSYSS